jgi:hypothetical protein
MTTCVCAYCCNTEKVIDIKFSGYKHDNICVTCKLNALQCQKTELQDKIKTLIEKITALKQKLIVGDTFLIIAKNAKINIDITKMEDSIKFLVFQVKQLENEIRIRQENESMFQTFLQKWRDAGFIIYDDGKYTMFGHYMKIVYESHKDDTVDDECPFVLYSEELINVIKSFYEKNNDVFSKKEMPGDFDKIERHFHFHIKDTYVFRNLNLRNKMKNGLKMV